MPRRASGDSRPDTQQGSGLPEAWAITVPASIGIVQVFGRALLYFFEHRFDLHVANRLIPCQHAGVGKPRRPKMVGLRSTCDPTASLLPPGANSRGFQKMQGTFTLS